LEEYGMNLTQEELEFEQMNADQQNAFLDDLSNPEAEEKTNYIGLEYEEQHTSTEQAEQEHQTTAEQAPAMLTQEQLDAAREKLYQDRQAQMQRMEQEHQARLAQLQQQELLMRAAQNVAQQQPELSDFEKAVQAQVDARLKAMVAPQLETVQRQMVEQQQRQTVQNTLQVGMSDPTMPNFDTVAGMAINRYGKEVVMARIMNSAPAEAARWMYQLGMMEMQNVAPQQNQAPAQPQAPQYQSPQQVNPIQRATPQPPLPRGMQMQGGSATQAGADWQELDKRIDRMSFDQLEEFRKNPSNNKLYERMLRYGTTNPNPPSLNGAEY
jgi:hypothetical protein